MNRPQLRSYVALGAAFLQGSDTPSAFLQRCLRALDERDGEVQAFVSVNRAGALRAAEASSARWRAGKPLSRIDGMPIGIKDIIETADMPTGQGAERFAGHATHRDAAVVLALREAGAVVLGKTATTEFAASHPASTRNPCDPARTPGGSSSGSAAAIAAGMLPAALGTQVVGSILRPASYCGVVGYKPSVFALNRGGAYDYLSQSCMGVLGASLDDVREVAAAIAERVGGDPGYPGLDLPPLQPRRPLRLAALELGAAKAEPAARAALDEQLRRLRAAGVEVADRHGDAGIERLEQALARAFEETRIIINWEAIWPIREYASSPDPRISASAMERAEAGRRMALSDYRAALARRKAVRALVAEVLGGFDGAVALAALGPAPLGLASTGNPAQNVPASYAGIPAITLPLMEVGGLPLGLQLLGGQDQDAALLDLAAWMSTELRAN